ncbi:hypothetical protein [Fischerella muscicola]|uniref:hypothetical protein n=1 Tax=Fischerella muscicola TaxID=92938 RepID=UPI0012F8F781|nr:hypothetical protein [Fischerella muscicola]
MGNSPAPTPLREWGLGAVGRWGDGEMGRWGGGELTGPHSPKGVGIRGSGGSVRSSK